MPIFRYKCPHCGLEQKLLVAKFDSPVKCTGCGAENLEKLPSAFAAVSGGAARCPSAEFCPSAGGGHSCCGGACGCHH